MPSANCQLFGIFHIQSNFRVYSMNQNRPFYSTNTNLYDEFFRSSAPTTLNGENVILSQEQQRRVCDTLNTSIVGNPFDAARQVMCAQKQYFPGGVLFTFPQIMPQHPSQGVCQCTPLSIPNKLPEFMPFHQPPAAVNTFFPSSMEYQHMKGVRCQQPPGRDSFQLKFHHDCNTSCTDLLNHFTQVPASRGYPDLSNITGILEQTGGSSKICQTAPGILFPSPPIEFSSNARKLVLSKIVPSPCGQVVDLLDENKDPDCKKRVSFSDTKSASTEDKSSQITSECICDAKKCRSTTKKQKSNKQKKKNENPPQNATSSETTLSSASEDDNEEGGNKKTKKKPWWNCRKKTDSESADSEASRPENDKEQKKKNSNEPENISRDDSDTSTNSSHPGSESEDNNCYCH